jgi:hypothetical protein
MKITLKSTLVLSVLFIHLTSCSTTDEPIPPIVYDSAELVTRNYLTSAASFDWLVNGQKVSSDLQYAFGSKGTFQWSADSTAKVKMSIHDSNTESEVFNATFDVIVGRSYYSALVGSSTSSTVVITENDPTTPTKGTLHIRFLHAYQNVGPVDIYIGGTTADHKKVTNLDFAELSAYIEVSLAQVSLMIICTKTNIAPDENTNLLTIGENSVHSTGLIYEDALASINTDPTSRFSLFVTEQ